MSTRRSFLKGLCTAAALSLARLLPPLAPENDWGFHGPRGIDDCKIVFEYVPMCDWYDSRSRRFEVPQSVLLDMAGGGDKFAEYLLSKHGRITRVVSNAEFVIFRPDSAA